MADEGGAAKEVNGRLIRKGERDPIAVSAAGFRMGREPLSELVIADPEASRLHAEIRYEGGRYVLYDFSANGTWVNAERVVERRTLRAGDVLRVGNAEYRFLVDRAPAGSQTPPLPPAGTPPVRGGALAGPTMRRVSEATDARPGFLFALLLALAAAAVYFLVLR